MRIRNKDMLIEIYNGKVRGRVYLLYFCNLQGVPFREFQKNGKGMRILRKGMDKRIY